MYNEKLNQLHLYDSNLNGFPGFPVPGTLKTCVGDLNNDGLIELVIIVIILLCLLIDKVER